MENGICAEWAQIYNQCYFYPLPTISFWVQPFYADTWMRPNKFLRRAIQMSHLKCCFGNIEAGRMNILTLKTCVQKHRDIRSAYKAVTSYWQRFCAFKSSRRSWNYPLMSFPAGDCPSIPPVDLWLPCSYYGGWGAGVKSSPALKVKAH